MLRLLPPRTRSQLRSSVAICSPCQCVDELVLNSLDASATCVAVRVDLSRFWIQVVDNGDGITENDLEKIGTRYMTSKCHSIDDLQNLCHYGYRGEALASIREISNGLEIQTRGKWSSSTFSVEFTGNQPVVVSKYPYSRPSSGTTVTVDDLFYSLPVRKKCFGEYLELERIRERLEAFSLIHPNVSISLRNDAAGCVLLQSHKSSSTLGAFAHIFGGKLAKSLVEICNGDDRSNVSGYFSKEGHTNKNIQYVFINGRLVLKSKVHKTLNVLLSKSLIVQKNSRGKEQSVPALLSPTNLGSPGNEKELYPVFVVRIDCPLSEYDITFDPGKTLVEFRDWNALLGQLQRMVGDFLRRENLLMRIEKEVSEKYEGFLSSDEIRNDTAGKEQVRAPGPAGYGEGINSYDRSNVLASSTARRAIPSEKDAVSDEAREEVVADDSPLMGTCCGDSRLILQQEGCGTTDDGSQIGMILGYKPIGDVTSDQHDVDSKVKSIEDRLDHCNENISDEETLPIPKQQREMGRKDCRKEANIKDETWNIQNHQMISNSKVKSIIILDSPEVVTTLSRDITVGKSRGELNRHCPKSEARSVFAVKEATENCLKRKKLYKKYVDISSTDSERTPDYSVDLPDICGRKSRRSSLRCQKKLSYPSSLVSVKTNSVGRKESKWKRPHLKRKSVKSSSKKISCKQDLRERTSKRNCVDSCQKRILDRDHSKVGISKCIQTKVAGQAADEKHVSCGYTHDQDGTVGHSRISKQLGITCLESPTTLFHHKRTRPSSERKSTGANQKERVHCQLENPDDDTSMVSSKSKMFRSCGTEPKDIAEEKFAYIETSPYEDENPMEPIRSDDVPPREIPTEVSANDHSSLWKFRQEKKGLGSFASSQSEGSQRCTQTVRTSRLWRRIRRMYKKTPALLKCHGYDHNQENINDMFLAPIKPVAKKTGGMEAIPKETLPDVICLEADGTGLSKAKEYDVPERRDTGRNSKGQKNLTDDVYRSGLKMDNNDKDTGRSKGTFDMTLVTRTSEQGQLDHFSGRKFVDHTELGSSKMPERKYRHPVFRENLSRTDHSNEYHYKRRSSTDSEPCLIHQYHKQFDNQLDSTSRYKCIETDIQRDTRKKSGEEYWRKWNREFEVDHLDFDQMDIRRTHPKYNVCSNKVHYSVGDADRLCPPFPDDCMLLVDVKATERVTKRVPQSRQVCTENEEDLLHQRRQESLDQSSWFKHGDSDHEIQEPKNLYQDLIDQSSKAGRHRRNFLSVTSKAVESREDGKTGLTDGSCSPYFCPLLRMSSKDMPSCSTGRDYGRGGSGTGFRDSLPLPCSKEVPCKESDFYAGAWNQSRPNLVDDDCYEKGFENRRKSQQVSFSSVHHTDCFDKNVEQQVHGSYLSRKQTPMELISDQSNTPTPESCQIYGVMGGDACISTIRSNESDLIDLGWLPRKEQRNSRQRANDKKSTRSHQSLIGHTGKVQDASDAFVDNIYPVEPISITPEAKRNSGNCKRLDDPKTSGVKDSVEGQTSSKPDVSFGSSELDHVGNMQRFREVFSIESGDLGPWEVRKNNSAGRLVGPRNLHVHPQDFDPELPPSGGTLDSNKFPCTQGFEITIADEQTQGMSSQDTGSWVHQGFDDTMRKRQISRKRGPGEIDAEAQSYNIVKESEEESLSWANKARCNHLKMTPLDAKQMEKCQKLSFSRSIACHDENIAKVYQSNVDCQPAEISSKDVDNEFCVFTPSITDITNSQNKKELSSTFQVENAMSQPPGKKLLLQRYNEEIEKTKASKVEKNTVKLPEDSLAMTSSMHSTGKEVENGAKSTEKDNLCDANFSFLSWHQGGVSHTESVGGEILSAQSESVVDAAKNLGASLGGEVGHRLALEKDETVRTKTPESQHLVSECLSDILQDSGCRSPMSDILKKHTPEWLKCTQDILSQSTTIYSSAYDLEASLSILPQKCIDVITRDQSVDATTQGQSGKIPRTCCDGSEDLFSTWPSLTSGQDISSQAPSKAGETVTNDDSVHALNSYDTQILPSSVSVALPEDSHYGYCTEADLRRRSPGIAEESGTSKPNVLSKGKPSTDMNDIFHYDAGVAGDNDQDSLKDNRKTDFTACNLTAGNGGSDGRESRPEYEVVTTSGSEFRMAKDLVPGKAQPKGNEDGCSGGSDSGSSIDAAVVKEVTEMSGGCCAYTCMIDPKSGRTMYVHLTTGNTTYEKPTFTDRPSEAHAHNKDKMKRGFTQHRFLSHGASPVMPRPKEERKVSLSTTPSEKMTKLFQVHKEKQDADRDVKWRQTGGKDGGCSSGEVEKMFAEWNNPVFKEPPQEVMSIEIAGKRWGATKVCNSLQSFKFTKDVFHSIKVVEQVDQKFIACLMSMNDKTCLSDPKLLVFVDQHAAHERIRLEKSIMDLYDNEENVKSVSMIPAIKLMVGTQQVRAMVAQEKSFKKIGVHFEVEKASRDTVLVKMLPKCLCKQGKDDQAARCSPELEEAVMDLLREHAETLQRSSGAAAAIPKPILKLLWSQSCHGAIKFGDRLSHTECEDLITSLSACNLPFQCAHGRPSMVPIIDLDKLDKSLIAEKRRPSLQRLRKLVEVDQAFG